MKKLLFSLVAAAACGAVTAAPVEFTGLTTFDPAKPDDGGALSDQNRTYWEINTGTDPELAVSEVVEEQNVALDYLKINTGSTPLWRTFSGVDNPVSATNETLDAAAVDADGKVVSSDVKLTACTEWPTLTDFANEKLAIFLYAPEGEVAAGSPAGGLYAVGGAMVTPEGESTAVLTNKAYKLTVAGNDAITNTQGWATIKIKAYDNIVDGEGVGGFVIAVGNTIATVDGAIVEGETTDYTGFKNKNLTNAAATRLGNAELIPAAIEGSTIVGLGFQGEGGIDNVDLAATDFAVDAVTMTVDLTDATLTEIAGAKVTSLSADGNLEFDPGTKTITFRVSATAGWVVTVKLGNDELTATDGVYSFTPAANAKLTVTAAPAAFQIGDAKYATLAEALAGLTSGSTLKLLSACDVGTAPLTVNAAVGTVTLDLNGQTIQGSGTAVIVNNGATLTITNSIAGGCVKSTAATPVAVQNASGTLTVADGDYIGNIVTGNRGTVKTYINGGRFTVKVEAVEGFVELADGKVWSETTDKDGYYTLVVATSTTVDLADAETGADVEVTPTIPESVTEVTVQNVPQGFAGKVVIPSTVEKINLGIGQLKVLAKDMTDSTKSYDITDALMVDASGNIVLNAEVTVNGVPVKPALADGASETPFVVGESTAATVKTIPGLKYSLVWDSDLSFNSDAKGGTEPVQAKTDRLTLEDKTEKPTKRFYKVKVSK